MSHVMARKKWTSIGNDDLILTFERRYLIANFCN